MANWQPPNPAPLVLDRRNPSTALQEDIPAVLDWLRSQPAYTNRTIIGTIITARDTKVSFRVDGEPAFGTPGTFANYTLTPLIGSGGSGLTPPTSVERLGTVDTLSTLTNVSYVHQFITPTVNVPLSALILEQVTATGQITASVLDVGSSTVLATVPAAVFGSGLRADLSDVTLIAGRQYRVKVGQIGPPSGALTSVRVCTSLSWTGLSVAPGVRYWDGVGEQTTPGYLPLLYVTGDMTGTDPSGVTHRATLPATLDYDAQTRTYTHGVAPLDLSTWGQGSGAVGITQWQSPSGTVSGASAYTSHYTVNAPLTVSELRFPLINGGMGPGGAVTLTVGGVAHSSVIASAGDHLSAPLMPAVTLSAGATVLLRTEGNLCAIWTAATVGSSSSDGALTLTAVTQIGAGGVEQPATGVVERAHAAQFITVAGTVGLTGRLPPGAVNIDLSPYARADDLLGVSANLTALIGSVSGGLSTRLSTLEGAQLNLEAVQDAVAAMLGTVGSYNDAAGTYTITLPSPRTDEEIQDVVAALIAAGANITKTYDDAGNVLTLSASGGSGGSGGISAVSHDASLTGDGNTTPLGVAPEFVQDTVAAMLVAGSNVTLTYDDAAGTYTIAAGGGGAGSSLTRTSPGSTVGDDFNRANGSLGAIWATLNGTVSISNNRVSGSDGGYTRHTTINNTSGMVSLTLYGEAGLVVRYLNHPNRVLFFVSGSTLFGYSYVANGAALLLQVAVAAPSSGAPKVLQVNYTPTTLAVIYDGVTVGSLTNSTHGTVGLVGLYAGGPEVADNFTFGQTTATVTGLPGGYVTRTPDGVDTAGSPNVGSKARVDVVNTATGKIAAAEWLEGGSTWAFAP